MLGFKVILLIGILMTNDCKCYEAVTDIGDIYTLYVKDSTSTLISLSNFHNSYTPFRYDLNYPSEYFELTKVDIPESSMTLKKHGKFFCVKGKVADTEWTVKLKKKSCTRLKVNKIQKKFIGTTLPDGEVLEFPDCQ